MSIPTKQFPEQSLFAVRRTPIQRPIPKEKDKTPTVSNIWLINLDGANGLEYFKIQSIPLTLGIEPTANWSPIPILGRNNPFYHYTGGEDSLAMQLDWYSTVDAKDDVILKCRQIESLSRSDGWDRRPPRVQLIWGDVFFDTVWIVTQARYELSLFDKENNMYPIQAYQNVVLKKVIDHNTTMRERRFKN